MFPTVESTTAPAPRPDLFDVAAYRRERWRGVGRVLPPSALVLGTFFTEMVGGGTWLLAARLTLLVAAGALVVVSLVRLPADHRAKVMLVAGVVFAAAYCDVVWPFHEYLVDDSRIGPIALAVTLASCLALVAINGLHIWRSHVPVGVTLVAVSAGAVVLLLLLGPTRPYTPYDSVPVHAVLVSDTAIPPTEPPASVSAQWATAEKTIYADQSAATAADAAAAPGLAAASQAQALGNQLSQVQSSITTANAQLQKANTDLPVDTAVVSEDNDTIGLDQEEISNTRDSLGIDQEYGFDSSFEQTFLAQEQATLAKDQAQLATDQGEVTADQQAIMTANQQIASATATTTALTAQRDAASAAAAKDAGLATAATSAHAAAEKAQSDLMKARSDWTAARDEKAGAIELRNADVREYRDSGWSRLGIATGVAVLAAGGGSLLWRRRRSAGGI